MFDEAWRHVDAFMVHQAAALWVNEEPVGSSFSRYPDAVRGQFKAFFQMLRAAILRGELKADHSTNTLVSSGSYGNSTVTREELIRYARQKGLFPAFLFDTIAPELDGDQEPEEQKASKKKRGRPPEYDYDLMYANIVLIAHNGELPEIQARLVEDLLLWFSVDPSDDTKECKPPSDRLVKDRVRTIYNNLKRLGWSPEKPTNSRR